MKNKRDDFFGTCIEPLWFYILCDKDLFNKIIHDIICRPYNFTCFDQPYIVYNAFKYKLYNNKILKSFAVNNDNNMFCHIIH